MKFRILGPVDVEGDGKALPLGGRRERALLAALILGAGDVVSTDRLAAALWGDDPPRSAAKTLQNHVLRLRKVLGPAVIETRRPGYRLVVGPDAIDARRFEKLLRDARNSSIDGAPDRAAATLREALQLWRGPPLEELAGHAPAEAEAARLAELRRLASEDLMDADLACGRHTTCVAELESMVAAEPLRERRWAMLMLALYRCGRQADALRAYQRARTTLAQELGVEPGPELRAIEQSVIAQDPGLGGTTAQRRAQLPSGVVSFLLTDVEGSTGLWDEHPDAMAAALQRHDEIIGGVVTSAGGLVLKARGEGDSTFSVFTRATDALAAALTAQRALVSEAWLEPARLSVRMAVHTGEAFERDGDYYGPAVNRAARIRSLAGGGQVLVSQSTGELVRDHLPDQSTLVELGSHVLSGLARAERVSALVAPGLPEFPTRSTGTLERPFDVSLPVPAVLRDAAGELFVGRGSELDLLMRAWKDAGAGDPRVVLLGGEPGVGKTRVAAELARIVSSEGGLVLCGRCEEDIGIPYQPWIEALRYVLVHGPRDLLPDLVREHGGALAQLMPDLASAFGEQADRPPRERSGGLSYLFGAVVEVLARVCGSRTVLLVLEDLHWADAQSLLLLRHVIASPDPRRLLIVGTYRPTDLGVDHPLPDMLASMHREPSARRLDMHGLSGTEVVGLLEAMAGQALDDTGIAFARGVHRETDGNPFFTTEIVRHLTETGVIAQGDDGRWIAARDFDPHGELPTSVREVIGRRVARLGVDTGGTMRAAAVIGCDFELHLLARVTEQGVDRVLDLLDPAVRAGLLHESSQRPDAYSFSHELVVHALYDELGPNRQRRLHLRVATALETLCGDDPGDRVGELAVHWLRAGPPTGDAKAIDYARRAGDRALARWAPDDAAGWYDRVLELLDHQPVVDGRARCEALVCLGNAQRMGGRSRRTELDSRHTLLEAADLAQRLGDRRLLVQAALATGRGIFSIAGRVDERRVAILDAALRATAAADAPERAMLSANLAVELTWTDPDRAHALSDDALAMARRLDDDATLEGVLWMRPFAIWSPATLEERTANAYELRDVAERLGTRLFRAAQPAENIVLAATCRGDLAEVDEGLDVLTRFAAESGLHGWRRLVAHHSAWRRLLAGDVEGAERAADDAVQINDGSPDALTDALTMYALQIYPIRLAQGRLAEIIEPLEAAYDDTPGALMRAAYALALCELDRLDEARIVFEPLVTNRFAGFFLNTTWLIGMTACAEVAAYLEHRGAAATLAESLAPWRDQLACAGIVCAGSVARPLGLALATAGRLDEADEAFAQAAAVHERIDAPIELARTHVNWAGMIASRHEPGDPDRALVLLEPALNTAKNLGLATIRRQAEALLAQLADK